MADYFSTGLIMLGFWVYVLMALIIAGVCLDISTIVQFFDLFEVEKIFEHMFL